MSGDPADHSPSQPAAAEPGDPDAAPATRDPDSPGAAISGDDGGEAPDEIPEPNEPG